MVYFLSRLYIASKSIKTPCWITMHAVCASVNVLLISLSCQEAEQAKREACWGKMCWQFLRFIFRLRGSVWQWETGRPGFIFVFQRGFMVKFHGNKTSVCDFEAEWRANSWEESSESLTQTIQMFSLFYWNTKSYIHTGHLTCWSLVFERAFGKQK